MADVSQQQLDGELADASSVVGSKSTLKLPDAAAQEIELRRIQNLIVAAIGLFVGQVDVIPDAPSVRGLLPSVRCRSRHRDG
jgi:hypothetical protein